jgi:Ca2+-binding RTX toxin-like protein
LKHPGAYNAGGGKTPGPYLPKADDNTQHSLMSYKDHPSATVARTVDREGGGFTLSLSKVQAEGFQMLDLAALGYLYGRSTGDAETAAQTWSFDDDDAPFLRTLSNSNAASEIDASATTRANVIDLRAGKFSSIGLRSAYAGLNPMVDTAKEYASVVRGAKPTYTGANNLGIAEGSHIDKAKGGSGNDVIVGNNDAANTIDAGAGNDTVYLGKASSTVACGAGTDTVCLQKIRKSKWSVTFDAGTGTYTCRNGAITSTVTGAEAIKGWDGKRLKISKLV